MISSRSCNNPRCGNPRHPLRNHLHAYRLGLPRSHPEVPSWLLGEVCLLVLLLLLLPVLLLLLLRRRLHRHRRHSPLLMGRLHQGQVEHH